MNLTFTLLQLTARRIWCLAVVLLHAVLAALQRLGLQLLIVSQFAMSFAALRRRRYFADFSQKYPRAGGTPEPHTLAAKLLGI